MSLTDARLQPDTGVCVARSAMQDSEKKLFDYAAHLWDPDEWKQPDNQYNVVKDSQPA